MKSFNYRRRLPAAPGRVLDLICSENYYRERYQREDVLELDIDIQQDDETTFVCDVRRVFAAGERIPRAARKFVGERITVLQTTRWSREGAPPYQGHLSVTVPGMPGEIRSDLMLAENGANSSELEAEGAIRVNIPLVGRQIERFLSGMAEETFAETLEAIHEYVKRH